MISFSHMHTHNKTYIHTQSHCNTSSFLWRRIAPDDKSSFSWLPTPKGIVELCRRSIHERYSITSGILFTYTLSYTYILVLGETSLDNVRRGIEPLWSMKRTLIKVLFSEWTIHNSYLSVSCSPATAGSPASPSPSSKSCVYGQMQLPWSFGGPH